MVIGFWESTLKASNTARAAVDTTSTTRLTVHLILYSVVQRSITFTWPMIAERIVSPLQQAGMHVRIGIVTADVGAHSIDGCKLSLSNLSVVPYDDLKIVPDELADAEIDGNCTYTLTHCPMFRVQKLSLPTRRNAMRMQYMEAETGRFLKRAVAKDQVDVAVVMLGDAMPVVNVSVADVRAASQLNSTVFLSGIGNAGGYTNGFYIGHPEPLTRILLRNDYYMRGHLKVSRGRSYEANLAAAFRQFGVRMLLAHERMPFFKIRADNYVASYMLALVQRMHPPLRNAMLTHVLNEYRRVTEAMRPNGTHVCMSGSPLEAGHVAGAQADGAWLDSAMGGAAVMDKAVSELRAGT